MLNIPERLNNRLTRFNNRIVPSVLHIDFLFVQLLNGIWIRIIHIEESNVWIQKVSITSIFEATVYYRNIYHLAIKINKIVIDNIKGDGTEQDPYKIKNITQLQAVNQEVSAHYELVSDIDATNTVQQEVSWNPCNPFNGTFDGNNYEIRNLCIKRPEKSCVGLFSCIDEDGLVRNLGLVNVSVTGTSNTGSLVGFNSGKIESSHIQRGDLSADGDVGGLVGFNSQTGKIESSYTLKADVSGDENVGGLVGYNRGDVESSYAVKQDVSGEISIGGLAGRNKRGLVESSYAVGVDVSGYEDFGGLIGRIYDYGNREGSFVLSNTDDERDSLEDTDLVLSRGNHEILYVVQAKTLYIQIDNEMYSVAGVSPTQVHTLVDERSMVKMTNRFRASVVKTV